MQVDADILRAARAGDPAAMRELLTVVQPNIRRYAAFQCGPATAIDDVVQEALIIINRRIGTIDNLAAFGGWLARVVARLCLLPALQLIRAAESLAHLENSVHFATRPVERTAHRCHACNRFLTRKVPHRDLHARLR